MRTIKSISINLLRMEIFIVGIAIGISMVFTRLLPYALVITAAFWVLRWLGFGYPSIRTPIDWAVVILIAMVAITNWATLLPHTTRPQVYRLLLGIGFCYAIVNWTGTQLKMRFLLAILSLTGLLLSLFGLFSVEWDAGKVPLIPDFIYHYIPTLVSDLIHRNVMAGTLVLIIPIPISMLIYSWRELKHLEKIIFTFSAISMILILILTQSRAAWMAFGFSILIMLMLHGNLGRLIVLTGLLMGVLTINFLGINSVLDALLASNTIGGIEGRAETWSRALFMIKNFPFTGVGMGSFMKVADTLYPFMFLWQGKVEHAHNLFLQVGVDLGIPGLIGWLGSIVIIFSIAWQLFKKGKYLTNKLIIGLGIGTFCSQVALCIHGVLDAVTWGMVRPAPVVWAIWGLTMVSGMLYLIDHQNIEQYNSLAEM